MHVITLYVLNYKIPVIFKHFRNAQLAAYYILVTKASKFIVESRDIDSFQKIRSARYLLHRPENWHYLLARKFDKHITHKIKAFPVKSLYNMHILMCPAARQIQYKARLLLLNN